MEVGLNENILKALCRLCRYKKDLLLVFFTLGKRKISEKIKLISGFILENEQIQLNAISVFCVC